MTGGARAAAPAAPRATPAILALYVKVGACLLAIGADVRRIVVAGELRDGRVLVDQLLGADQLVSVATVLEVAALAVALALLLRWWLAVRAGAEALGVSPWSGDARLHRLVRAWVAVLVVAVVAVVASRVLLGAAEDVGDRQRIDVLRALATAFSGVAAGVTIAVVSAVTARQQEQAATLAPPASAGVRDGAGRVSEGGLRVVSEEQARTGSEPL